MSFAFGAVGDLHALDAIIAQYTSADFVFQSASVFFSASSQIGTLQCSKAPEGCDFSAILGTVFDDPWRSDNSEPSASRSYRHGQFIRVTGGNERVVIQTDAVGHRDLYYTGVAGATVFSTSLATLCEIIRERRLDLRAFGSRWLCYFPLGLEAPVKGIHRIAAGDCAIITVKGVDVTRTPWTPDGATSSYEETLTRNAVSAHQFGRKLALGLTGGLDSRTLLALLRHDDLVTYTFGEASHPDVQIAGRISDAVDVPHHPIESHLDFADLKQHAGSAQGLWPLSHALLTGGYVHARELGRTLIEGAFGEISRRQMMNRLVRSVKHRADMTPGSLLPSLLRHRADIFTEEVDCQLYAAALDDLSEVIEELPTVRDLPIEDWADLLLVRRFVPTVGAIAQSQEDMHVHSITPFTHDAVLSAVFRTPIEARRNGRIFRRMIRNASPVLTKYPMFRGSARVRFGAGTFEGHFVNLCGKRLGLSYRDSRPVQLQLRYRSEILDIIRSEQVRSFPLYDINKVDRMVQKAYWGDVAAVSELDWFLAFELWRSALGIEG